MKVKRALSIIISILLIIVSISNIAYGEGENTTKEIIFELYDGKTNGQISEAETVSFAVYKDDGYEQMPFDINENFEASITLEIGQTYNIKTNYENDLISNEITEVTEEMHDRMRIPLYKANELIVTSDESISAEIRTSGNSGVDVSIIKDNLPEDLKDITDEFRVVVIPGHDYDIEEDGLPAGFNSNLQEPLENTRHEDLAPGGYTLFVGFYDNNNSDLVLIGYTTKNITITEITEEPEEPGEPGESEEPGEPGEPGPEPSFEETFEFYYEGEEEPFYTTNKCMSNIMVNFPGDEDSVKIKMEVVLGESGLDDFGGWGVLEYVVDRSQYVVHSNENGPELTVYRNFGKVTLHYMYDYHNKHAFITFYEEDFVGIDVEPEIGVGDWGTGVVDASGRTDIAPTSFVYFLNEEVFIRPSDIGKEFEILSIEGAEAEIDGDRWRITLPDIIEPVVKLTLTLEFEDNSTNEVPLEIRRVLLDAFSMEYNEEHKREIEEILESGDEITTPRGTPYEYNREDFIAFIGVFAEENYLIDHTLLVMYYENDRILGAKQFEVKISDEPYRDEITVYRKGHIDYASFSKANRITAFLISKEGVQKDSEAFGGTTFGIGAGWGHLMPNHRDWGSGKDGMDYE